MDRVDWHGLQMMNLKNSGWTFQDIQEGTSYQLKGATSRYLSYFDHRQNYLEIERKPENNTLQRKKSTKEIIINHKGTSMAKDGEDWNGLPITKLKKFGELFQTV